MRRCAGTWPGVTGECPHYFHAMNFERCEIPSFYSALTQCRACATPHQIRGLREMADNDVTKTPGYDRLSAESQEQLKLAFEEGRIADKDFKSIRPDPASAAPLSSGCEILDAEGYKVDMPVRAAGCRASGCGNKVVRGELRVGFLRSFDGDHSSWVYKHWYVVLQTHASFPEITLFSPRALAATPGSSSPPRSSVGCSRPFLRSTPRMLD
jgi:hypothetical protein